MPVIKLITRIKAPIHICFDLSRSIDLHKISTSRTGEEAIDGVKSGLIGLGEQVTWRAKHLGFWQQLTSKITAFEHTRYFQDTMLKGAFKKIVHDHVFEKVGEETIMTDTLDFESPLGILGKLANTLLLTKYLTELLVGRNRVIKEVAESDQWKKILNTSSYESA